MNSILKNLGTGLMLIAASLCLSGCVRAVITGDHDDNYTSLPKENINVDAFNKISSVGPFDIRYTQGENRVTLYCNKKLRKYLRIECNDSTLRIFLDPGIKFLGKVKAVLEVSSPRIDHISRSGSGDIYISDVSLPSLTLEAAGSGDMELYKINCDHLNATSSGSGDIEIDGLNFRNCMIQITGSGDIDVTKCDGDNLEAQVSGSGDISVSGTAQTARLTTAGSGEIDVEGFNCGSLITNTTSRE